MHDPDNRLTDAYEPEVGNLPNEDSGRDEENVVKTGTTTVGLSTEDGVIIATDRRASLGGRFVSNKQVQKVEQIHPTAAMTLVGSVGGAQSFIRSLRAEADLYEVRRDEPLSIHALATLAGNFARGGPYFAINPIVGGVDEEGSHVYSVDPAGGVLEDDYTVTGSGTMVATGTIEGQYDHGMSLSEARDLAIRAVNAAAERDTGSGNGVVLAEITDEGVEIDAFDDYESAE
ncbi:archaeal proteasome endopeptidase complex subunit beta [Haloarcula sp. JP-Z28]|uniref:Proteasome subunit beta n=1 Tax=Haloarcula marismortui ATCC 33800 TaxID=662476 RepID=M0K367_9EURY|nr:MULTISPECIES: archaeal proteasome endopeptidase complex subunit beta [Haloarcula]EMA15892.1 proteasome subunit alpha [Haloarcula sinaiiensis ATCC 33800]NHN61720.1 archaeal proteasome endopeptidase complex subunit beta [Haloarcula sp. JP-Z28]QUJ72535.1 archaeal proteasome endopeptidase complex subunit beta [Haloarcula sinaiiensis ATCC 33800]